MGVSRPVGRVLCSRSRGAAVIHLGLPLPTASCGLPASIGRAALDRSRREPMVPLLTLLRVGFTKPPQSPAALVVSYTAVSPLPRVPDAGRSVFCGTVPRVTPGRRYRPPCPVEPGPSSPGLRPARPPGRLTRAQDTPNTTGPEQLTDAAPPPLTGWAGHFSSQLILVEAGGRDGGYGFPGRRERQARSQAGEREDGEQVPVVEVGDRDREYEQDDRGDPGQHAAGPAGTREPD